MLGPFRHPHYVAIILSIIALLITSSTMFAQEQDRTLIDRLLRPNLASVNPAQNKSLDASGSFRFRQFSSKGFWVRSKPFSKSFPAKQTFMTTQMATSHFPAETKTTDIASTAVRRTKFYYSAMSPMIRIAPENDEAMATTSFAGNRSFSETGKNQKTLSAQERPLTIQQVRKLLNKNK